MTIRHFFVRKVRQKLRSALPDTDFIITHHGVGYRFDPVSTTEPR
jgi:DNA-binding response OmpR family regulator